MAESSSHQKAKRKAAGRNGHTEVPLSLNRRLDALTQSGNRATEVERSGNINNLRAAARRLRDSDANQIVLQVPQQHMDIATKAMKDVGVKGTVKNMGSTKRRSVR